jgi:hypothetical protein
MGQLHLFATRADLLLVLSGLEARYVVQFVRGKVPVHTNPLKLPRLGIASNESSIASTTYSMFPKGVRLRDRPDARTPSARSASPTKTPVAPSLRST